MWQICLDKCNLNDESLRIFVKCHFPEIQTLNFKGNHFSDNFLQIIVLQKWNKLKEVDLSYVYSNENDSDEDDFDGNVFNKDEIRNRNSNFTFLHPFKIDENNKLKS